MKIGKKSLLRLAVVLAVTAAFLIPDIVTKRWAEANLANWAHMLPVVAGENDDTAGAAVSARFPDLTDDVMRGRLFKLPMHRPIEPEDRVHELESKVGTDIEGFLVFEPDRRFVRRVGRMDSTIVRRLASRGLPGQDQASLEEAVKKELADVTVRDFILERVPAEGRKTVDKTIREGMYVIPRAGLEQVDPSSPAEPGATYLLAERTVTVVENFWEYSYVENPAGAFSMLLWLDGKLRLAIFLGFGIIAIFALGFMILKPPSENLFLNIALGAVLGGAIGNYGDRVTLTYVVDFIDMYWRDYHWPRYNIADIGITGGVIVLLLFSMFSKSGRKDPK